MSEFLARGCFPSALPPIPHVTYEYVQRYSAVGVLRHASEEPLRNNVPRRYRSRDRQLPANKLFASALRDVRREKKEEKERERGREGKREPVELVFSESPIGSI